MGPVSKGRVPKWRWLRLNIRSRSAVISAVVVAVSLGIGGSALIGFVYASAAATVDAAADTRLRDITTALEQTSPDQIDPLLLSTDQNIVVVQVVDASGAVVRASTGAPDIALTGDHNDAARHGGGAGGRQFQHAALRSATVTADDGAVTAVVGSNAGNADETITTVTVLLVMLALVITAVAGGATYYFVGRSLRSMERLRRIVSEITAADLSERVSISENRDEISALAETMNDMLERIESAQSMQRRFVSDASHELRSPLTTIAGSLELGRESPESIDTATLDHTLLPEVARMRQLVEDLLVLARADEGATAFRFADVDLDDIAQNEAQLLRKQYPHTVAVHLTPTRIQGDHNSLTRMLRNLTVNAARYANSRIEIDVRHDETTAYLEVGDDGPGIALQDRARVFDRFVRLEEHRSRAQGGSGLGLAIVAEIVAAHKGVIVIADRPGGGTVMTVRLPLPPED